MVDKELNAQKEIGGGGVGWGEADRGQRKNPQYLHLACYFFQLLTFPRFPPLHSPLPLPFTPIYQDRVTKKAGLAAACEGWETRHHTAAETRPQQQQQ